MTSILILISLLIDYLFAEPKRYHPLVGFGYIVNALENKLLFSTNNESNDTVALKNRLSGLFACLLLVVTPTLLLIVLLQFIANNNLLLYAVEITVLYLAIGSRSLEQHALQVKTRLMKKDLDAARINVSYMVSRETQQLNNEGISKATIESVLENGSDALFAPLFWFVIAGAPGALCYRLINTLDAMWGYRNERYRYFGWFAARLDDAVNWLPARISAVTYALSGNCKGGLKCWFSQAKLYESPNAGPVMASGAGALNLQLGGSAIYHGETKSRPALGSGLSPEASDIDRAIKLIKKSLAFWMLGIVCLDLIRGCI